MSRLKAGAQAVERFAQGASAYPLAKLRGKAITSFWGFKNFGDLITPLLIKELGYVPINCPRVSYARLVLVGSVLDSMSNDYSGIILGSGFLRKEQKKIKKAKVLGVRGEISKKLLGITSEVLYGDAGLLLPYFLTKPEKKKYMVGVVPHYSESKDIRVHKLASSTEFTVTVINVLQDPVEVFREIGECQYIVSSSLHGLVLADSMGIPNVWMKLSARSELKYHDYYSAFQESRRPQELSGFETLDDIAEKSRIPGSIVNELSEALYKEFIRLPERM
ncbi:MAG: polysaccharide pyruvyl transferase family protein [Aquisalimonadaceae bacterium]